MDIFESLENLNVSEECFDEIMGIVEELLSEEDVYEPAAYAKDGYNFMATGSNKLNGKLYKVHTKHDKGVTKTKLYAKDGDSARKLVQKAYGGPDNAHTLANESLYNEIGDLVKAINEKVTVERVRKAAENSIPTRQAKFEKEAGDPDALPVNPNAYKKAADKLYAAKKMANLPKGDNRDYAKLRKAARKVRMDRDEQAEGAWAYSTKNNPETDRLDTRLDKADLFAVDSKGKVQ